MERRGRKVLPAALHKLHGNPRKDNSADLIEPEGRGGALWSAPQWMDEQQREQWAYALEVAPLNLLTATDRELLAVWVVASVEYAKAVVEVRKLGQVVKSKEGVPFQNPFLGIANRQARIMLSAGAEMGFSPISRAQLGRIMSGSLGELPNGPADTSRGTTLKAYLAQKPDRLDS